MATRNRLAVVITVVAAVAMAGLDSRAAPPDCSWHWVNPAPPRLDLHRVVANAGRFVAVGASGVTLWSLDGQRWERTSSGVDEDLYGVDWGAGAYVAVGDEVVLRSSDGRLWAEVYRRAGTRFTDVAYGAARFVAVGDRLDGRVATSVNGTQWALAPVPWGGVARSVTASDSGFMVAVGTEIWDSYDGLDWSYQGSVPTSAAGMAPGWPAKALTSDLFDLDRVDLAWTGDRLLWAAGPELWSRDGDGEWQLVVELDGCSAFEDWLGVIAGPGWAMASGISGCPSPYLDPEAGLYLSFDGGASFSDPWLADLGGFPALGRYGSRWVALGALGDAVTSVNAADWQCPNGGCTSMACADGFADLAVGEGVMVAVGGVGLCDGGLKRRSGSTAATSADGEQWVIHPLTGDRFRGVAWTGDEFLAVGDGWLAHSVGGSQWATENAPDGALLRSLGLGNGWLVAVGENGALYSREAGSSWIKPYHFYREDLNRAVWDGGQFLVVGTGGMVLRSRDALNWFQSLTGTDADLHGVASGAGVRIAVGDDGLILSSPDGEVWAPEWSGFSGDLGDVAFHDGRFVAVGWEQRPDGTRPGVALVSAAGERWTRFDVPGEALRRVLWAGDAWVAVGGERSIVRSECLPTLVELGTEHLQAPLGGSTDLEVRISGIVAFDTTLTVASSHPGLVVVPETVVIAGDSDRTVVPVTGAGVVSGAVITVTLPKHLGGGSASVPVSVQPPLWTPRRPSGRVAP